MQVVRLSKNGQPEEMKNINNMCCAFTEIKVPSELYLVAVVNREGQIRAPGGNKSPLGSAKVSTKGKAALRRPVAVGVCHLQEFIEGADEDTDREFTMQLFKSDEDVFADLHRYIIRGESTAYVMQPLICSHNKVNRQC